MKVLSPEVPHRFLNFILPASLFLLLLRIGELLVGLNGSYNPVLVLTLLAAGFVYLQIRIAFPRFEGFGLVRLYAILGLFAYLMSSVFSFRNSYFLFELNAFHSWIISLFLAFIFFIDTSLWRLVLYSETKHILAMKKGNELIEEIRNTMVSFVKLVDHLKRLHSLFGLFLLIPFIGAVLIYQSGGLTLYDVALLLFVPAGLFIARGMISSLIRNLEFLSEGIHPGHKHNWPLYRQALGFLGITFVPVFIFTLALPVLNIGIIHDLLYAFVNPMTRTIRETPLPDSNPWSGIAERSNFDFGDSAWLEVVAIILYIAGLLIILFSIVLIVIYILYPLMSEERKRFWGKVNFLHKLVQACISAIKSILFFFSSHTHAGHDTAVIKENPLDSRQIAGLTKGGLNKKQQNKLQGHLYRLLKWGEQKGLSYNTGQPLGQYCEDLCIHLELENGRAAQIADIASLIEHILYAPDSDNQKSRSIHTLGSLVSSLE